MCSGEDMSGEAQRTGGTYSGTMDPCAVVLFGASGDLATRKVIPALYDLATHNSLGPRYALMGFARTPMSDEAFRASSGEAAKTISEGGPIEPGKWQAFGANLFYQTGVYGVPRACAQ